MEIYWIIAGVGIAAAIFGAAGGYFGHRPAIKRLEAKEPQVIQVQGAEVASPYARCSCCDHTVAKFYVRDGRVKCMNCQMEGRE